MLPYLIVAFAIAMALGPIMLMRPSASQSRLAKLRTLAHTKGLKVRMANNPCAEKVHGRPSESVSVYSLDWGEQVDKRKLPQEFLLMRLTFSHGLHFMDEWDWQNPIELQSQTVEGLKKVVVKLNESVVAIESSRLGVGFYWREKLYAKTPELVLEEYKAMLVELRSVLLRELSSTSVETRNSEVP